MEAEGRLLRLRHEDLRTRAPALGAENVAGTDVEVSVTEVYDEVYGVGGVQHKKTPVERRRRLGPEEVWLWGYGTPREDYRGKDTGGFWMVLDPGPPPLCANWCRVSEVQIRGSPPGDADYEEIRVWVCQGTAERTMEAALLKAYGACEAFPPAERGVGAELRALPLPAPGAPRADGAVPLHVAARGGHATVAAALLEARADPEATCAGLRLPSGRRWHDVLLQPRGPALETEKSPREGRGRSGRWTPALLAASWGHAEVLRVLLAARADAGRTLGPGESALHAAAAEGRVEALRLLIRARADPSLRAESGAAGPPPLALALTAGHEDAAKLLLRARADPDDGLPPDLAERAAALAAPPAAPRPVMRYRLAPAGALPPAPPREEGSGLAEVRAPGEATALFRDCPAERVVCCGFGGPTLDPSSAQLAALQELAGIRPRGLTVVHIDIEALPTLADWAGIAVPSADNAVGAVAGPLVRLYQANISVIGDFRVCNNEGGHDALRKQVASIAKSAADAAQAPLEALAAKHPGALHGDPIELAPKEAAKLQQHGLEVLKQTGAGDEETAAFDKLCAACKGEGCPRPRDVATLARLVRRVPVGEVLPLLDLARRVMPLLEMGGSAPGARHATEILLDAALQQGFDNPEAEFKLNALALACLSNALVHRNLREGLLPIAGLILRSRSWQLAWDMGEMAMPRLREAAASLLFNCSVALRTACFLGERGAVLSASVKALAAVPQSQPLNWAVGNLLAVGGRPEEAAAALRAQPLPPLRRLAAAVLRGGEEPAGTAFPEAWR